MKVKDLILRLGSFDPEAEIVIDLDYGYDFQDPDFERTQFDFTSALGRFLPKGSYVHKS